MAPTGRSSQKIDAGTTSRTQNIAPGPLGRSLNLAANFAGAVVMAVVETFANAVKRAHRETLVKAQDAARAEKDFQPRAGTTFCNKATVFVVKEIGGPLEPLMHGDHPALANQQSEQLAKSAAYRTVSREDAQALANSGVLVIATQKNATGHGHIATVRPEGVAGDSPPNHGRGPLINHIGAHVQVCNENWAFLKSPKVIYFTPKTN